MHVPMAKNKYSLLRGDSICLRVNCIKKGRSKTLETDKKLERVNTLSSSRSFGFFLEASKKADSRKNSAIGKAMEWT